MDGTPVRPAQAHACGRRIVWSPKFLEGAPHWRGEMYAYISALYPQDLLVACRCPSTPCCLWGWNLFGGLVASAPALARGNPARHALTKKFHAAIPSLDPQRLPAAALRPVQWPAEALLCRAPTAALGKLLTTNSIGACRSACPMSTLGMPVGSAQHVVRCGCPSPRRPATSQSRYAQH